MTGRNGVTASTIEIAQSDQELVGSKKRFNVQKLGIILAIVLLIVVVIVVAVLLTNEGDTESPSDTPAGTEAQTGDTIKLEDILEGTLQARRFNGTWLSGTEIMYRDKDELTWVYNIEKRRSEVLVAGETRIEGARFEVSADRKYILVAHGVEKIFRHSFAAKYTIIEVATQQIFPLTIGGQQLHFVLAMWGPVGNAIVIVNLNNIYYKPSIQEPEIQITTDGTPLVYNGVPDWVYEEEVFSSNTALWFSEDGKNLAYVRFNDTPVKLVGMVYYGNPGSIESQYPHQLLIRYPKPGSPNPIVHLFHVNLENLTPGTPAQKYNLEVPSEFASQDHIITTVSWANSNEVITTWMNRVQNMAIIQSCKKGICENIGKLRSTDGWVELFSPPIYNKDGTKLALITSQPQGEYGGYRHLTIIEKNKITAITKGRYVVQDILRWERETNYIFYTANTQSDSKVLHVYAIKAEENALPQCLTCDIVYDNKIKHTYFSAEFPTDGKYFVLIASGPSTPRVDIFTWDIGNDTVTITKVMEWEKNIDIRNFLATKSLPTIEFDEIQLDSGFTANVMMSIPPNADRSGASQYPMLVDVYGGPDSYAVINKWSMDWGSYLAASRGVIYARIDGSGSGLRGDKLLHAIYRKLGIAEINDQIETARKLQEKYSFISKNHTAIWGWSYGGYASAMSLAYDDNHVFSCAASVAPVTDWTYYDSIYTERYMGLPVEDDNLKGYNRSRLSTIPNKFKNKNYLLVHGTFDDNVHYQQAMALSRSLERSDILFSQMTYPDEDHALAGVRHHLYHTLGKFFGDCFESGKDL